EVPSELQAIVGKIKELTESLSIKALPQPWLPPLPSRLFVEDMRGADELAWSGVNEELEVLLGLLDKPSQQAQAPLSINLSQDGHLILYGAPATGKTTFLQTTVLDLARHYSPSELHFYLMDFGTSGLVPMGDLPHVADVFLLDQGEKIGKFIRLLEKEINRRKKLLTEHRVGTLSMYRQLTGQVEPRIVIALDSFESMKDESFEAELLKLLTRISREGQAIGLHLVVTASRQANLRATFYSNFKHQLTLKQHDKTEVRSVVGSTGLAEIEDIKGRALYKGEEVYSLQLALPLRVEHDLELVDRMREEVSRQKAAWSGQVPEAIPMVPEELTREDFLSRSSVQKAIASGQIPLGLDLETVEAVSWQVSGGNFLYLYEKEHQLKQLFGLFIEEIHEAGYKIALIQPGHGQLSHPEAKVYDSLDLYVEMIEALTRQLEIRMEAHQTTVTHVLVWEGYEEIIPQLSASHQESLAYLFDKGARYGFVNVIAIRPGDISKLQDKASRMVKAWKDGLLGMRVTDQSVISPSNRPLREGVLGPQEHYVLTNNQVIKVVVAVE
ncbi:FtsK/SpoIIIE domain-containing protein, partial [Streptococcus suis]